jgi:uncharacterized protein (TIGR03435 family)
MLTVGAFAQRVEFEVASLKRNTVSNGMDVAPHRSGDLITMHNAQVYSMIYYAWHLTASYQMVDYPDLPEGWRWYDVDARMGRDATDDELRLMFQSLLEDRFKLKAHRETRELPVYELTLAKGKSRLLPSTGEEPMTVTIEDRKIPVKAGSCSGSLWNDGTHLLCHAATMGTIAKEVSLAVQSPVVDHSGLAGTYDLHVRYVPEKRRLKIDGETGPSFAQAFPDETGIKLEKGKGPVEVLVIEHLEKPTDNQ